MSKPLRGERLAIVLLVVLLSCAWMGTLVARHLDKTDEGRYAEIPREMVASGDWLTPRLDGLKYFEKPALQYWATAAAYRALGVSEWSSRLWVGLTSLAGVFLVGFTGTRLFGRRTGVVAGAVLASSLLYLLMGHVDTLDMGTTFFMAAGLCAALLGRHAASDAQARWPMALAWLAFGAAVLSKGLIGIVLPGAVLVLYLALTRDWIFLKRALTVRGTVLFVALTAPWFIAVSVTNPGFAHFFFIHEHFERFLTTSHHREGPWWYFLPVLAAGLLPWVSYLPGALLGALVPGAVSSNASATDRLASSDARFAPELLLAIWSLFIFAFFSISSSKLPSYVLPIFPALALLIGKRLTVLTPRAHGRHAAFIAAFAIVVAGLGLAAARVVPADQQGNAETVDAYTSFGCWLVAAAAGWLAGALVLAWRGRRNPLGSILGLAAASVVAGLIALVGYASFDRISSSYYVAQAIAPVINANTALYSVEMYDQSLPFYLGRTMTLVNQRDELDFGLSQEPARGIPDLGTFANRWLADRDALAVMPPTTYPRLEALNLPMHVILHDRRFVVVSKP